MVTKSFKLDILSNTENVESHNINLLCFHISLINLINKDEFEETKLGYLFKLI